MKKTLLLGLFAFATIGLFAQNTDLLRNGSFEEWKKGIPVRWGIYYSDQNSDIFSESKDARTGSYAIQVDFEPKKEHDNRRFFSHPIELEAGKYSVTLYLKGEGEIRYVSLTKKGEVAGSRNNDVNIVGAPKITGNDRGSWTPYTLTFDVKDSDSYQLFICVNQAKGLLIDDVSLTKN